MPEPTASRSIEVAATPDAVYAILSDPNELVDISEETIRILHRRSSVGRTGSRWIGINRHGWRVWPTMTRVTDAVPGGRFAFDVDEVGIAVARWQYDLEPTSTGVRVTESMWDRRPAWFRRITVPLTGVADRASVNDQNIGGTLRSLKARAEASD